jgi:iron-sulfur cluster assembly protein
MPISLTEVAVKEVLNVMNEQDMDPKEFMLRVGVQGGGCSGFSYSLTFEKQDKIDENMDVMQEYNDLKVAVDAKSEIYIDGTEIDFYTDINRRGFVFNNPQSRNSCGCGSSFGV